MDLNAAQQAAIHQLILAEIRAQHDEQLAAGADPDALAAGMARIIAGLRAAHPATPAGDPGSTD
jgi:hypothetical protein